MITLQQELTVLCRAAKALSARTAGVPIYIYRVYALKP